MEDLLKRLIEQNNRLIDLGEKTVQALSELKEVVSSGLSDIQSQLDFNDSSSNVSSVEMSVSSIVLAAQEILEELRNRE